MADDCIVVYEPIEFPFFKERTPTDSEERTVRMDGLVGSLLLNKMYQKVTTLNCGGSESDASTQYSTTT